MSRAREAASFSIKTRRVRCLAPQFKVVRGRDAVCECPDLVKLESHGYKKSSDQRKSGLSPTRLFPPQVAGLLTAAADRIRLQCLLYTGGPGSSRAWRATAVGARRSENGRDRPRAIMPVPGVRFPVFRPADRSRFLVFVFLILVIDLVFLDSTHRFLFLESHSSISLLESHSSISLLESHSSRLRDEWGTGR